MDVSRDPSHHWACYAERGLKLNIFLSLIVCLFPFFFFFANIYLAIGLEFRTDGKYMALAERRNCKDCISIFSCSVWQLVRVINFYCYWLRTRVNELSKSIFGVPSTITGIFAVHFACYSIEVLIGHNYHVVVVFFFFLWHVLWAAWFKELLDRNSFLFNSLSYITLHNFNVLTKKLKKKITHSLSTIFLHSLFFYFGSILRWTQKIWLI